MVFEKSLTAMVKGIRAHRGKEPEYINTCLQEIRNELVSKNVNTKSTMVLKLSYLNMMGYDMGWASFGIVEVKGQTEALSYVCLVRLAACFRALLCVFRLCHVQRRTEHWLHRTLNDYHINSKNVLL